uniref:Uncharacterized protein n=1 Tax=Avena sativa TaxID=4498 RepID=A0ACD5U0P9_AVESA
MDAIAYGQQAIRFNRELRVGEVYFFKYVGFEPTDMPSTFPLAIPTEYYVIMHARTEIHHAGANVSIPTLPSRFMDFIDTYRLRNRMLTDIIGIVVHVGPVRFSKSFERSTPCRDVILMNIRGEFIVLRIWDKHVARHMTKWRLAEQGMWTLAATLLEKDNMQGALKTTQETQIVFEPDNWRAIELAAYRLTLGPSRGSILCRVRTLERRREKMGLYANLRLGRL